MNFSRRGFLKAFGIGVPVAAVALPILAKTKPPETKVTSEVFGLPSARDIDEYFTYATCMVQEPIYLQCSTEIDGRNFNGIR